MSSFPITSMAPPQTRSISLRNVTPSISENPIHLDELKQDLVWMRCDGLLERPWALKREQLVWEMVQPERPNIFDETIRDRPQLWTANLWRDTYHFSREGSGLSNRMEGHHEGCFMHQVDPKDGYFMGDCRNDRQRRLLEFLVLIVHSDKPTRVTITIGNTIFGALDGGREVDWGVVFRDMAQRLARGVGKSKPTPIFPFLFHLYEGQGLLTADEAVDYRTVKEMAGYRITLDPDSRPGTDEDEPVPTPAPSPRPGLSRTPNWRRKSTYRVPSGSPPVRSRGPSSLVPPEPQQPIGRPDSQPQGAQPEGGQEWVEKPFVGVARSIRQARVQYESMEEVLEQIGSELGVRPNGIIPAIRSLPKAREMEKLRARISGLLKDNDGLQAQVADRNRRLEEAEARAAVAEEERIRAEAESTKWHGVT